MLIECPECKNQVSEFAKSCPHCGCRIAPSIMQKMCKMAKASYDGTFKVVKEKAGRHKQYMRYLALSWWYVVLFLVTGLLFFSLICAAGLVTMGSWCLLITGAWVIRMIPTKKRYAKYIRNMRKNKDERIDDSMSQHVYIEAIKSQLMKDSKMVKCPKCGSEISVDFIKCPDCHLKIGKLIDAARGK